MGAFEMTSDFEFYCFLKASLPEGYSIEAEPSTAYYSEWQYHYRILRAGAPWREYRGDFQSLEPGALVLEAQDALREAVAFPC